MFARWSSRRPLDHGISSSAASSVIIAKDEVDPPSRAKTSSIRASVTRRCVFFAGLIFLLIVAVIVAVVTTTVLKKKASSEPGPNDSQAPPPFRKVLVENFPDPAIIRHGDKWYAFATNNAAGVLHQPVGFSSIDYGRANVQIATSSNFLNWTLLNYTTDPLPQSALAPWVAKGFKPLEAKDEAKNPSPSTGLPRANVWAPDIVELPTYADSSPDSSTFLLYYSAARANATKHCIGASVSTSIAGPYTPLPDPLACPLAKGGAIDPAPFVDQGDNNTLYVLYKVDGNSMGHGGECGNTVQPLARTPIMLQRMASNGTVGDGSPVQILDIEDADGPLVEAPAMIRTEDGTYVLFFSSGCTRNPSYDIKYATSKSISGPYVRAKKPLLKTGDWDLLAPGSVSVRREGERWRMAFHARVDTEEGGVRALYVADLKINGTEVSLVDPL